MKGFNVIYLKSVIDFRLKRFYIIVTKLNERKEFKAKNQSLLARFLKNCGKGRVR